MDTHGGGGPDGGVERIPQGTRRFVQKRTLQWSEVGTEVVILDRALGELLRLNSVAGFIWKQLDGTRALEEIVERVSRHFATDATAAGRDVREFLGRLKALELLEECEDLAGQPAASSVERGFLE